LIYLVAITIVSATMVWHGDYLEFVHLPAYRRSAFGLLDDDAQRALELKLCEDPEAGDVIVGTGGVRKIRVALPGRGTRGGARVVYFFRVANARIYLILAYAKNRRDSLTRAEKNEMRKLVTRLEGE
jgi:hypothetical protein